MHSKKESRGYSGTGDNADLDNHSDQCNPNNDKYKGHQEKKRH